MAQIIWHRISKRASFEINGEERKLWGFTVTLGYSRTMMAKAAVDQKPGTLLRMHEGRQLNFREAGS